jgi:hypothetical protein
MGLNTLKHYFPCNIIEYMEKQLVLSGNY